MVPNSSRPDRDAYAVTVDASDGISTGISAADRTTTIRRLALPTSEPDHFRRPGHVVPVRIAAGGALRHPSVATVAFDLAVLAGRQGAGVMSELVSIRDPTQLAVSDEVQQFANRHGTAWP